MSHREEQERAREAKRLKKEKVAQIEAQQRFYAERRAKMMNVEISADDLRRLLIQDDLIPEDVVEIEWCGQTRDGGIRLIAHKP